MLGKWLILGACLAGGAVFDQARAARHPFADLFNALVAEKTTVRRDISYGPLERQKLDLYLPDPRNARPTTVLFFYGGGWRDGDKSLYRFVGAGLAARGYRVVIADYRTYPDALFPAFMNDAGHAYQWAVQNLDVGAAGRPLVLMGHSAGGHIAALLALDPRYRPDTPAPAGVVGLAAPYAFDPTTWPSTREIFAPIAGHADSGRPVAFVSNEAPPMFMARGAEDETVAAYNADQMELALNSQHVLAEKKLYSGIGHVGLILAFARGLRWRAPALEDSVAFIERITAPR